MQLVDTHVHINFKDFHTDLNEVRDRWLRNGVTRLVHSCVSPDEFDQIQAIANQFPEVSFAVGLHPLDKTLNTSGWNPEIGDRIQALASSDQRVVAIGETGLDFFKSDSKNAQIEAFKSQLRTARSLNLPVIIHSREAAVTTRQVLQEINAEDPQKPIRGVMHCWAGNPEETQWFVDLGMYISFSGVVTFKNAHDLHESAKIVPSDRILVETDCPFLAPVPKRGKRNEPAYVLHVAETVAQLRGVELTTLASETTSNAYQLFSL
ncbi:TatD family hydrolase [Pseudanabaena mucicola]|uniref:D-aminoacyl-tRNA deacylase n=1 Tax=Pseudanabaena mucicola FACHB-723 TaxID=2692860 RepID=A0ABR7ZYM7_9CYAN|nr:TatD family hydrolase [Pseudanabaena mucicola]MBD2189081.1 TatD family hydrolase [Pseudanabaena mucicola FACHB-723]